MTAGRTGVRSRAELRWRRSPVTAAAIIAAVLLAAAGLLLSRPDVVALGMPLGLWAVLAVRPRAGEVELSLSADGRDGDAAAVDAAVDVEADADWVQLAVDQGGRRTGLADVRPGAARVRTESRLRHSGPSDLLVVTASAIAEDGAWVSDVMGPTTLVWNAPSRTVPLDALPLARRLTGLHGAHAGVRPGHGGDFRDIHPFAPGDELRRVDWRATARLARRPGDLLVRRMDAQSDTAVVIVLDTADDLGEVVATWGTADAEHSGTTSLDNGREAALAIATAAIGDGDRVAFEELAPGGRSVRGRAGRRQLEHLRGVIAATGEAGDATHLRRMPPIPTGSTAFVLSTFFDGAAADLAKRWQAAGQRVVALDVLPVLDARRLTPEQNTALRTLMAEREGVFADLRRTGVDVVAWTDDPAIALRIATRGRR